jgi:excisionase family DNA binding protein
MKMDLLTQREAARELHIAERVVREAVRAGELEAYKLGHRTVRVDRKALYEWVRSRRVSTWRNGNGAKA